MHQYTARAKNFKKLQEANAALYWVEELTRTSVDLPWSRKPLGSLTFQQLRTLRNRADKATELLSRAERYEGGLIAYSALVVHQDNR